MDASPILEESFFILQGILDLEKERSIPSMILPGSFLDSFFFLPILLRFQKEGSIPTRIRLGSFLKSNAFWWILLRIWIGSLLVCSNITPFWGGRKHSYTDPSRILPEKQCILIDSSSNLEESFFLWSINTPFWRGRKHSYMDPTRILPEKQCFLTDSSSNLEGSSLVRWRIHSFFLSFLE